MSVYKEAYQALNLIRKNEEQVFIDACDVGVPVMVGDEIWNAITTLNEYHNPKTNGRNKNKKYNTSYFEVTLYDEAAYSNGDKTALEAEETYRIYYTRLIGNKLQQMPNFRGKKAYAEVVKVEYNRR